MRFRLSSLLALALGVLALAPSAADAGPLRDRFRERHPVAAGVFNALRPGLLLAKPSACPCPQQSATPQVQQQFRPIGPAAVPQQACPGGVCPLPGKVAGAAPAPQIAGGVFDRLSDGPIRTRWLLRTTRDGAADRLVNEKRITLAAARELVNRVDDETITTHVSQRYGAAAGAGRLEQFFAWLWEHREELIKFILSIVALFGDEKPVGLWIAPTDDGGVAVLAVSEAGRWVFGVLRC